MHTGHQIERAGRIQLILAAALCLAGCEVGSQSKPKSPYRAPVSGNSGVVSSTASAETGASVTVSVTVKDKSGYGIPNVVPTITAVNASGSSTGVTSQGCGATNVRGETTCAITATYAGDYTIKTLSPVQTTTSSTVNFYQVPRTLTFTQQPSSSEASTAFSTQPKVKVYDKAGQVYTGSISVSMSLSSSSSGTISSTAGTSVTASCPDSTAATCGVAVFSGLKINKVGTYTLVASVSHAVSGTVTGSSSSITITTGAPRHLSFKVNPSSSTATGVAFSQQPQIVLTDNDANEVNSTNTTNTTYLAVANTCVVNLTLLGGETDGSDVLMGSTLARTMVDGTASFDEQNLRVSRSGETALPLSNYSLKAVGSGTCKPTTVSGVQYFSGTYTSGTFTITLAGVPAQLVVIQAPGTASLNETWLTQPIIGVLDVDGQLVTGDSSTQVIMTKDSTSPTGTLSGATSLQVSSGLAQFSALKITGTTSTQKGTYKYDFSGVNPGLTITGLNDVQQVISDNGLTPAGVRFRVQPTNVAIRQQMPTIEAMSVDSSGYYCFNDNTTTIKLSYPSGTCPSGDTMEQGGLPLVACNITGNVTVANGIAQFAGIAFTAIGAKVLRVTGTNLTGTPTADSNVVSISNFSTADHLTFVGTATSNGLTIDHGGQQPSDTVGSGQTTPWTTQPVVAVNDQFGNLVTSDNSTSVTVTCVEPVGCALSGTVVKKVIGGKATFTDLRVFGTTAKTGVRIKASATNLLDGYSNTFDEKD